MNKINLFTYHTIIFYSKNFCVLIDIHASCIITKIFQNAHFTSKVRSHFQKYIFLVINSCSFSFTGKHDVIVDRKLSSVRN